MPRTRLLIAVTQSERGGAQRYVYTLATALPAEWFEVRVVCGPGGPLIEQLRAAGIETVVLPGLVRPIAPRQDWTALQSLRREIERFQPHIVHCNSSKMGLLGRLAARLSGTPAIFYTAHGFVLSEPLSPPARVVYWLAEKIGSWAGHHTIAVSEADRRLALRYRLTPANTITTIYNGLASPAVVGRHRAEFGLPAAGPLVGTVANFYPTKGLAFFIQAAAELRRQVPGIHFAIVGDGEQRPLLEQMIASDGLEETVTLCGRRDDADQIAGCFDVFVISSVKEGLPFALLEAMHQARPIVATRVGGIPEVLVDGVGLLVEPANPEQLCQAVVRLLSNPAAARAMGEAARQRVTKAFSQEQMIEATLGLYRRALRHSTSAMPVQRPAG